MDPLPLLIQQMLVSTFYDHRVEAPIQLLQTHISFVVLTGDYVYKVKKPVNFGFLDFSSLEQRHHFCNEELRLNRRLSPEIYLEVVSMGWEGDRFYLHAPDPVEYAVKMRQFPQSQLFSQLFQSNQLGRADLASLAKQVAAFHQTALSTPDIQSFGDQKTVQTIHENNYRLSEAFIGWTQTQEQYEQTRSFTHQFFQHHGDWLEARQDQVKECHGDLHLNNVCRFNGQVQVFDCIEFNQEFRNIDVLYDSAFMVMDLEFQGRADFAYGFLNQYLEQTGDYEGVKLLPLYLIMRAYIRGNVNSLALKDPGISEDAKQDLTEKAIAYYKLAWSYTRRSQGSLYLMSGLSGSGKSTVAQRLAEMKSAIHIRSDAVRKHLAGIPLDQSGADRGIYTPEMTQKTYDRLLNLGMTLAQEGWTVILDAKYDRRGLRGEAIAASAQHHIPLKILHCTADIATLRTRLKQRQGDISDATMGLLDQQLAQTESFSDLEQPYVHVIETRADFSESLQNL
jgi:aminoglycoside phosphotransferase family enzyme/predicted kinase